MAEDASTEVVRSGWSKGRGEWTDEDRARQSEMAKRLHSEGKFGGAEFGRLGGRARHRTFLRELHTQEAIVAGTRGNVDEVITAILTMIRHNDWRAKAEGIKLLFQAEEFVKKHQREDEQDLMKLGGKELNTALKEVLAGALGADVISLETAQEEVQSDTDGDD